MQIKILKIFLLLSGILLSQGCFLITLPFQLVGQVFKVTFGILGGVINLLGKIPLPPPGVF